MLEKIWDEYYAEECAVISSEEEKDITRRTVEMQENAYKLLNREQVEEMEKYVEAIYEFQSISVKKAFFKGCEFVFDFFCRLGKF